MLAEMMAVVPDLYYQDRADIYFSLLLAGGGLNGRYVWVNIQRNNKQSRGGVRRGRRRKKKREIEKGVVNRFDHSTTTFYSSGSESWPRKTVSTPRKAKVKKKCCWL